MTLIRTLLRIARVLTTTGLGWVALMLVAGQIMALLEPSEPVRRPRAPATTPEVRRPPPPKPPAEVGAPPAGPTYGGETAPALPVVTVDWERKSKSSVGTAFRLYLDVWATARHVTESCRELVMLDGGKPRDRAVLLREHASADIALVAAGTASVRLPISTRGPVEGRHAYAYGWPEDKPGAVRLALLGSVRIRGSRSFPIDAVANTWAIVEVDPAGLAGFGGISGGPVLDEAGTVVGVAIASNSRRGTLSSAAWTDLSSLAAEGQAVAHARSGDPVPAGSWATHGEALRRNGAIRQIYCRFGKS